MAKSNKGNKKGLQAIFGDDVADILGEIDGKIVSSQKSEDILLKDIISNPFQPRKNFNDEKISELAVSIKEHGLLSPIIVRIATQGKYYLIAGERRARAAKEAGLESIPAIIKDFSDHIMEEVALIENIQREDLNAIEEAVSFKSIIDKQKLTQDDFSKKIGKSRSYVANSLRLLTLNKKIINLVLNNKLTYGHVKPLVGLEDELAIKISKRALDEDLNVRQVEEIVQGYKLSLLSNKNPKVAQSDKYKYAEELFKKKLKIKVKIKQNKIVISFSDDSDLNKILEKLDLLEDE